MEPQQHSKPNRRPQLIHLPISPWSARIRLACDVAGLDVEKIPYTPFMDELWLRWKIGAWTGKVSVPVVIDKDGTVYRGSENIARWMARACHRFILGDEQTLGRIETNTEKLMSAGRFLVTSRVIEARAFDIELVPWPLRWLPNWFHASTSVMIYRALRYKYAKPAWFKDPNLARKEMQDALQDLRDILTKNGGQFFSGTCVSYCDICVATSFSFADSSSSSVTINSGTKRYWKEEGLCEEFRDLIAWRDNLMRRL